MTTTSVQIVSPPIRPEDHLSVEKTKFTLDPTGWRVSTALATNLPGTASGSDLALVGGTFGAASPVIESSDSDNTSVTQRARRQYVLPDNYQPGQPLQIRSHARMTTNTADTSATIDFEIHKVDREAGIGSDLVQTAAASINSTAWGDDVFTVDGSGLNPGDVLDVRMTIAIVDASVTGVTKAQVGEVRMEVDTRG